MSQTEVQLIKEAAVVTADIADQAVTLDKLPHGTSSNNGKFLRANNGADPTFETVSTDLVADTTPQLGGSLDVNDFNILNGTAIFDITENTRFEFNIGGTEVVDINGGGVDITSGHLVLVDNVRAKFGSGTDLQIYHDGSNSYIDDGSGTGALIVKSNIVSFRNAADNEQLAKFTENGSVELYHNNVIQAQTTSDGFGFFNNCTFSDNKILKMGDSNDLQISHDGTNSLVHNDTGSVIIENDANNASSIFIKAKSGEHSIIANHNGGVELYHDNSKKFQTESFGATLTGNLDIASGSLKLLTDNQSIQVGAGADLRILHDGTNNFINSNNGDLYFQNSGQNKAIVKGGSLSPSAENIDLGESGLRWQNIHGIQFHGSGTNITNVHKSYAILLQRTSDTDVGTFTSGAFRTRALNVELEDPDGIVSLSSNQFTLQAGTYVIRWSCVAFQVDHHSTRLAHISGSFSNGGTEMGTSEYSNDGSEVTNRSIGVSIQQPTNANVYEIQHECTNTVINNGFGVRTMTGQNTISAVVEIFKIA